jgi:hypothetical protein
MFEENIILHIWQYKDLYEWLFIVITFHMLIYRMDIRFWVQRSVSLVEMWWYFILFFRKYGLYFQNSHFKLPNNMYVRCCVPDTRNVLMKAEIWV